MTSQTNVLTGISCPICEAQSTFQSADEEYIRCQRCGVVRTKYDYDASLYGTSYATNYLAYAESSSNTPLNLFRLGLVSRWLHKNQSLLDVGCCVGEFLRFAEHYYHCVGFEPNLKAAGFARQRCNSLIVTKLHPLSLPGSGFNCITLFDVIEHIDQPKDFLDFLAKMLLPGGIIALTTPNVDTIPKWNNAALRIWKHYKPKEHLFLHTELSLTSILQSVGLEVIHVGTEESEIRPGNPNGDILTLVGRKI